jgi:hypothetical protein
MMGGSDKARRLAISADGSWGSTRGRAPIDSNLFGHAEAVDGLAEEARNTRLSHLSIQRTPL